MKNSKLLLLVMILLQLTACSISKKSVNKTHIEHSLESSRYQEKEAELKENIKKTHHKQVGMASYYGGRDGLHKQKTASGHKFDKDSLTAAHPTLPFFSMVKVTNLENNKVVILTVNDRGPFTKNRIIDVSEKAAKILDMKRKGSAKVMVEYLGNSANQITIKPALKKHNKKSKQKAKK
jgi:rare lipoprotein A